MFRVSTRDMVEPEPTALSSKNRFWNGFDPCRYTERKQS